MEVIAGHDAVDSTSVDLPVLEYTKTVRQPLAGLRLGLVREHFGEGARCGSRGGGSRGGPRL